MPKTKEPAATAHDPVEAERLKVLGNELYMKNEYDAAHHTYSEAIKKDPTNAVLYANRAAVLLAQKVYMDAAYDCRKAVELDPKYAKAWGRLGTASHALAAWTECLRAWKMALDCLPKENLTPAQENMKAQFTQGLAKARVARKKIETSAVAVSDLEKLPWVVAFELRNSTAQLFCLLAHRWGEIINKCYIWTRFPNAVELESRAPGWAMTKLRRRAEFEYESGCPSRRVSRSSILFISLNLSPIRSDKLNSLSRSHTFINYGAPPYVPDGFQWSAPTIPIDPQLMEEDRLAREQQQEAAANTPNTNNGVAEQVPVPPARKRGRPRGTGTTAAKPPSKKAKKKEDASSNKENLPPVQPTPGPLTALSTAPLNITMPPPPSPEGPKPSTPEPATPKPATSKPAKVEVKDELLESIIWTKADRTALFKYFLDEGDDQERRMKQLKVNRSEAFREAVKVVFPTGSYTDKAAKSQWERSYKTYKWIGSFNRFTGNGGGDGDATADALAQSMSKITAARKSGMDLGSLNAKTVQEWEDLGWYDLFHAQFHDHPAANITNVATAVTSISDDEDENLGALKEKSTPARLHRQATLASSTNIAQVFASKTQFDRERAAVLDTREEERLSIERQRLESDTKHLASRLELDIKRDTREDRDLTTRLELDIKRDAREDQNHRAAWAEKVAANPNVGQDVKDAAQRYLMTLFTM
ncbi:hypothetical protein D9611_005117 [Ephemerocybe angulata]|uniref:Uncharacterized protein n=2 Tax=Ephemerocybe angulata TaxID=980116 RepID=A0A8H5C0P1_9AGAR|nr:hypothetical protein D9611_005117 [Tulosesus angulatus]